jgi:hypothetical protein
LCGILKDNLNNNKRVNMGVLKYKVVQIWPGLIAACLHTNKSRSYLNHLVQAEKKRQDVNK